MRLGEAARAGGFRLVHLGSVGSTNDEASALARSGERGPLWIVADEQGEGRGRRGRAWASPPGNLYASLLLVDPCPMARSPQLGFVAAVALHDAVATATGLSADRLRLKWPNDVLHDGAKLSGILVEGTSLPGAMGAAGFAAIVGIGVNVAHHPTGLAYPACDLQALGCTSGPADLFEALSSAMATWLGTWAAGDGFPAIRQAWLERAGGLGESILVRRPDGDRRGIFRDLDADGRLLLDEGSRVLAVEAGDVFLPGFAGATGS